MTGPPPTGPGTVPRDTRNTDLGFWGKRVIQGRYHGFRVIDVSNYRKPVELAYFQRVSPQGRRLIEARRLNSQRRRANA